MLCHSSGHQSSGFTLIELLVVIAIIAILAVVVVLTLNPAQLLAQSRDANRVSDMATLSSALGLYITDQSGVSSFSLGSSSVVYVSLPDPNATTSVGSNCASLGLLILPGAYSYDCAGPSYYRNTNNQGWIPVNFQAISAGAPFSNLPVDPVNSTSSRLFYTYTTNGSQFEVTAAMESSKYQLGGSNDQIAGDGASLATVYAKGSNLTLEPLDYGDTSLVSYWPLNEGANSIAYDDSGNNATGSWNGTPGGTSGYYSAGKVQGWAGYFNGSNDWIATNKVGLPTGSVARTVTAWIYTGTSTDQEIYPYGTNSGDGAWALETDGGKLGLSTWLHGGASSLALSTNAWHFVGVVYSGGTYSSNMTFYVDGQSTNSWSNGFTPSTVVSYSNIGGSLASHISFSGLINNVRVYNRALSAAQMAALYNGGK